MNRPGRIPLFFALSALAAGVCGIAAGAERTITIGMIGKSQSNPVFPIARTGAEDAARDLSAKLHLNIKIDWRTPNDEDAQKQAEAIEQLVLAGAHRVPGGCSPPKKATGANKAPPALRRAAATLRSH